MRTFKVIYKNLPEQIIKAEKVKYDQRIAMLIAAGVVVAVVNMEAIIAVLEVDGAQPEPTDPAPLPHL